MSEPCYVSRIGMSHAIDAGGVRFYPDHRKPGNALAQFEGWIEKIVQEEVEKRTGELRDEMERLKQTISNMEEDL